MNKKMTAALLLAGMLSYIGEAKIANVIDKGFAAAK